MSSEDQINQTANTVADAPVPIAAPIETPISGAPPPQQPPNEQAPTADVEQIKDRLKELENEAEKLEAMQNSLDAQAEELKEDKADIDARSVFVGNVDYGTTPEELQQHFQTCGTINRVTIVQDKYTHQPKGCAYIEFAVPALVTNALLLNETIFRGRTLKVVPKRTNVPGMVARGGFRGRGRGRGRGSYRGGFRGRGRGGFNPY